MNPRLRTWIFGLVGAALAVVVAVNLSEESYAYGILVALVVGWLVLERASEAAPDAWLLAGALVGYVVGNRGFAQMQPSAGIPLLPAEAVLMVALPALVVRMALKRAAGLRRDFLNYALLAWVVLGAARLPLDLRRFGLIALRDFAMVYYAAFFFVAQAYGSQPPSARLLRGSLTFAFVLLLPVIVSIQIWPAFLVEHFTWRGIPVIFQKSDLVGTSLAAGSIWLWTRWEATGHRRWILASCVSLLMIGGMASPRAAMAALAVADVAWLLAGRWRIVAAQGAAVVLGSLLALGGAAAQGKDLRASAPYSALEHAVSIFDPSGSGTYLNGESGDPGGNNRFRLIWWGDVAAETMSEGPAFGLGFGSDLAAKFLADYNLIEDENFSARSPHSMLFSVLGRMGLVGLAAWLAASAAMARVVWRLTRRGSPDDRGLAGVACVTWVSACFGIVLEGPMGALVFWTVLGLASARAQAVLSDPA